MVEARHRQQFAPGTVIFREGEAGDCAYVIDEGAVEISALRRGNSVVLARLGPGGLFGEMALIDGTVRSASARALRPTRVTVIRRSQVVRKMNAADPLISLFLRVVLRRLRTTNSLIGESVVVAASQEVDPTLDDTGTRRLRDQAIGVLEQEQRLETALEHGEFEVYLQPIVSLKSGCAAGFEAMLRWPQPDGSVVGPAGFLKLAEETEVMCRLGRTVLERACVALRAMAGTGEPGPPDESPLFVSMNLSARQLVEPTMVDEFLAIMEAAHVDPHRLMVEVTESALMEDPDWAAWSLRRLKTRGVGVAVDDFGTGYSSLSYLQRFPIDVLKIDRSFVGALPTSPATRKIVRAVARLAEELGMTTIAEGVERDAELTQVRESGCGFAQGFLFAPPVPIAAATKMVRRPLFDASLPIAVHSSS